jgi:hypothetical protein
MIVMNVNSVVRNLKNYLIDVNLFNLTYAKRVLEVLKDSKVMMVVEVLLEWMVLMVSMVRRVSRDFRDL